MNNKGFTLIERLLVVVIIGILAAIAIPMFSEYRGESHCSQITSDTKNAFVALEAYYAENVAYGTLADTDFQQTAGETTTIGGTYPLVVSSTKANNLCPSGNTYTLSESSGAGTWS